MKFVKKWLPYELYDAAGLEEWLGQMAARGLHLVRCGAYRAVFRPGEPAPGVRYRLEAQGFYEIEPDKNEVYAQSGWEYVTTLRSFYLIFRAADPAAPELHTDPVTQSYTMKSLMKRKLFGLAVILLYLLFNLRRVLGLLFTRPLLVVMNLILRDAALAAAPVMLFCLACVLVTEISQYLGLRRLYRRLAAGVPMDRNRHFPRSLRRGALGWLAVIALFASIPLGIWLDSRGETDFPLEDYPHITLAQVCAPETVRLDPNQWRWASSFPAPELKHSLLAPWQLHYCEDGRTEDREEVWLNLYCDRAVSPAAAELVVRGRMERQDKSLADAVKRAEELSHNPDLLWDTGAYPAEHPGFDLLYARDFQFEGSEPQRCWFGRGGNVSVSLSMPLEKSERALELLAAALADSEL